MALECATSGSVLGAWLLATLAPDCHALGIALPRVFLVHGDSDWPLGARPWRRLAFNPIGSRIIVLICPRLRLQLDAEPDSWEHARFVRHLLLHELAHCETPVEARPHGPGFWSTCRRFAHVLRECTADDIDAAPNDPGHPRTWPLGRHRSWGSYGNWRPADQAAPVDWQTPALVTAPRSTSNAPIVSRFEPASYRSAAALMVTASALAHAFVEEP